MYVCMCVHVSMPAVGVYMSVWTPAVVCYMCVLDVVMPFVLNRLQVVSTKVGGVPEVLPPDLITLAAPNVPGEGADSHPVLA